MGHVFISYSHKDTTYAHGLADHLRTMGFDIWMDEHLDYGSQWPHAIQKYLDSCDAFLLIMTPRSFASDWVQSELQRAKRKRKPVYPLLLEGDEPWLSVESTQYYDVRNRELPDDEFYSDLKQVVSAEQTISHSQGFDNRTQSVSRVWPAGRTGYVIIGFLIIMMSVCLVSAVLLLQRAAGSGSPLGATALPTTYASTALSSITTQAALTPLPVHLPNGSEVLIIAPGGDKFRYTLLSAQREPSSPDRHLLLLRIRVWTNSGAGVNFWNSSFRLVSGELSLAPVNSLNEIVEANETMDGNVEFEIDSFLTEAVLRVNVGRNPDAWATRELHLVFP